MTEITTYEVGARVSYEDMANPRRVGTIVEAGIGWNSSEYRVRWDELEDGETTSDLRQRGWRLEPALEVGARVTAIVDYDAVQPTGTIRLFEESVSPRTKGRKLALVALDHAEPGIGRQIVLPLERLIPLPPAEELEAAAQDMARYTPRHAIEGWIAGLRANGGPADELAVCERALEIAEGVTT